MTAHVYEHTKTGNLADEKIGQLFSFLFVIVDITLFVLIILSENYDSLDNRIIRANDPVKCSLQ